MAKSHHIATVDFHGHSLITLEQNGELYVAMKPIVEAIGLDWEAQFKRIKRRAVLNEGISMMEIPSAGGKQSVMCLPLKLLNGWLFGVDAERVKPEIRERVLDYQRSCYDVLHDYWSKGQATHPNFRQEETREVHRLGLTAAQQDQIKALHKQLVSSVPKEKQGKLSMKLWSSIKAKFGVSYKDVPEAEFIAVVSLMNRVALEGEHQPSGGLSKEEIELLAEQRAKRFVEEQFASVAQYHTACVNLASDARERALNIEDELRNLRSNLAHLRQYLPLTLPRFMQDGWGIQS